MVFIKLSSVILALYFCSGVVTNESCGLKGKVHSAYNPDELSSWFSVSAYSKMVTFCNDEIKDQVDNPTYFFRETADVVCSNSYAYASVKSDASGRPRGRGFFGRKDKLSGNVLTSWQNICYELSPGVSSVWGNFLKGLPEGKVSVTYDNGDVLEGRSIKGVLHGKTRLFGKNMNIKYIGIFKNGKPSGWSWIFPHNFKKEGVVYAYFDYNGDIRADKIVYLYPGLKRGIIGQLANNTYITLGREIHIKKMSEINCVCTLDFDIKKFSNTEAAKFLPIHYQKDPTGSRLFIRTSKIFFFNRIAKTGSQSISELLVTLRKTTGVDVEIRVSSGEEHLMQTKKHVKRFINEIYEKETPTVWVRHYNFVDFKEYGYTWGPTYFNFVRDPIERVISWYYYRRASWNIVERKLAFPKEELPDPEFLRKGMDSCVLDPEDSECNFIPGSSILNSDDHRSQMMGFCGHEILCATFESKEVLQKAKENVEKFYPVVGVLENLNASLAVLEFKFPDVFPNAKEIYFSTKEIKRKRIKNYLKPSVANEVKTILRSNFTREIEFYDFCKQRLATQLKELLTETKN